MHTPQNIRRLREQNGDAFGQKMGSGQSPIPLCVRYASDGKFSALDFTSESPS